MSNAHVHALIETLPSGHFEKSLTLQQNWKPLSDPLLPSTRLS